MKKRLEFYKDHISQWIPNRKASVLVVAAGRTDYEIFSVLGFKDVVLSNIDQEVTEEEIAPYSWSRQNVEELSFAEGTFDYVVVHAGLHHCQSPHRGLLEMYRVCRKAVIAVEPPDNLVVRIMQKLGMAQVYEITAVRCHDGQFGGMHNKGIPNFVYRWNEREIKKMINSFAPYADHHFYFAYGSDEPAHEFIGTNRFKRFFIRVGKPFYGFFSLCFPKQQNLFVFMIEKPSLPKGLQPWITIEGERILFNPDWKKKKENPAIFFGRRAAK